MNLSAAEHISKTANKAEVINNRRNAHNFWHGVFGFMGVK